MVTFQEEETTMARNAERLRRHFLFLFMTLSCCFGWQLVARASCPANDNCPAPNPGCGLMQGANYNCCSFHSPDCCDYTCTPCYYIPAGGSCSQPNGTKHSNLSVF